MKKIPVILILLLLFTSSVYANARLTLSDCKNVKSGDILDNYLKIAPADFVASGTVITLTYENANVFTQDVIDGYGKQNDIGFKGSGMTYQYRGLKGEYKWDGKENFEAAMPKVKTSQVPYRITRKSIDTVEIRLCGIPKNYIDRTLKFLNYTDDVPYYYIPFTAVVKDGDKEVKVNLKGPANGFVKDTTLIVANKGKKTVSPDEPSSVEATTEVTTEEQPIKASVKIGSPVISVNGHEYTLDTVPYIQQSSGSTMIPLRAVSLALSDGYRGSGSDNIVSWDANTKTAIINYKNKVLEFTANAGYVIADGKKITMNNGVFSEITDNRMFVPFRALGEAFDITIGWDSATWTASFN